VEAAHFQETPDALLRGRAEGILVTRPYAGGGGNRPRLVSHSRLIRGHRGHLQVIEKRVDYG
jgi:hypothetical protein